MNAAAFYKKLRQYLFAHAVSAGLFNSWSDERFIRYAYRRSIGRALDLENPKGFNEKLQWLKLHDRRPEYTTMVDKYEAKKYFAAKIGEEYIVPTLGVWDSFDEIDFDALPEQFVLKCTHDSGGIVICRDKSSLDIAAAREKMNKRLARNFFWLGREWPYKDIKPRIIAEPYLVDESETELKDYKLMCFNGQVKCSFTNSNRYGSEGMYVNFYDNDWKPMPFVRHYPRNPVEIEKPVCFAEMKRIAEELSEGITFVRIDFYQINKRPVLGEITFFPGNGLEEFSPYEWDLELGSWISLPEAQQGKV